MHPRRGSVVRPLLSCRRHELRAFLAERQASYVDDESNADVSIPRNRVRAELLPLLEARFNPAIVDVLADEADLARETWQWMEAEADELRHTSVRPPAPAVPGSDPGSDARVETSRFDASVLLAAPLALRRFVVWRAMSEAAAGRPVAFGHVQAALELLESSDAGAIDAPGHRVDLRGRDFVLTSRPAGTRGRVSRQHLEPFRVSAVYSRGGAASRRGLRVVRGNQPGWRDRPPGDPARYHGRAGPPRPLQRPAASQESAARGPVPADWARRAEKAAGLLRGPEGGPAAAR